MQDAALQIGGRERQEYRVAQWDVGYRNAVANLLAGPLRRHRELLRVGQRGVPGHLRQERDVQQPVLNTQDAGNARRALHLPGVRLAVVEGDRRQVIDAAFRVGRHRGGVKSTGEKRNPVAGHVSILADGGADQWEASGRSPTNAT